MGLLGNIGLKPSVFVAICVLLLGIILAMWPVACAIRDLSRAVSR